VDVHEVSDAPSCLGDEVDLLVVGGPTHAFGMSRPATRQDAAKQALVSTGDGIREWIEQLALAPGMRAATFDTRIRKIWVPGSASRAALKRLRRIGCDVPPGALTFFVEGTRGPLVAGELARARGWGEELAQTSVLTPTRSNRSRKRS
jgi:hypothetical protein